MRAHGVQRIDAQAQNLAVLVERQFAGDDLVAALRVAQQRFRARRHPFDRTAADAARRPHHQRILGIAAVLHAEAAADVRRDDAQLGLGDFQHLGRHRRAGAVRVLRCRVQRVAVAVGMILADRGARLDRVGGNPAVVELERNHVLGAGERGVGRVLVAHHQRERNVVGRLVPHRGRARLHRIFDGDDGRQRLVVDLDQFGGVARLHRRFRDHEGDAVADRAHLVGFEDRTQRAEALRAAHILRHRRREAAELVGDDIGAGEHREHALGRPSLGGVDAFDARMRMRRHDNGRVALVRQLDVVDIAAAAGDEARVLDPGHGLTDAELVHAFLLAVIRPDAMPGMAGIRAAVTQVTLYLRLAAMRMDAVHGARRVMKDPGRPIFERPGAWFVVPGERRSAPPVGDGSSR